MKVRGTVYELECDPAGILEYISATVPVPDENQWPQVTENPQPGVAYGIQLSSPGFSFVAVELRVVEGLLSLWGVEGIDVDDAEEFWLPDNETERERLKIFSMKRSLEPLTDDEIPPTSFDLVARSFIAAWDAQNIEAALSFFRKGRIDSRERRYIEAIYDFYFVLETMYGEGKTKNYQVKQALQQNSELCALVQSIIADKVLLAIVAREPKLQTEFQKHYAGRPSEEILAHFVDLRGFLHHHTRGRSGIWHPEDHSRFEVDALVLEHVAYSVAFKLIEPHIFSDETVRAYQELLRAAGYEPTSQTRAT